MKKRMTAVLLAVLMIFTCAVPVSAEEGDAYAIEDMMAFSDGLAWVAFEDGIGAVDESLNLVYRADIGAALTALGKSGTDRLVFEFSPFEDGLAYYQADGYGFVIIDEDGEEVASRIWTGKYQPKIVARSDDSFIVSEYNTADGCNYVYLLNKKGKMKGKKQALGYGDVYFDYMGEDLYTGVVVDENGNRVRCIYSEAGKDFYLTEAFNQGHFFGFDDKERGFVFEDSTFSYAYAITADDLMTEADYLAWAEGEKNGFQTGAGVMDYYYRTLGEDKFYSGYHHAYINNAGETVAQLPGFGGMTPVMFGRFLDDTAPVVYQDGNGGLLVTRIDETGNACFPPVRVTDAGSEIPVLTDQVGSTHTFGENKEEEEADFIIYYDEDLIAFEAGDSTWVIDDEGEMEEVEYTGLKGISDELLYFKDAVCDEDGSFLGDSCYETEDTVYADQDWLDLAGMAGTFSGDRGSTLILYADGEAFYQRTGTAEGTAAETVEFTVEDGILSIIGEADLSADVSGFDGNSFVMTSKSSGEKETFTRQIRTITGKDVAENTGSTENGTNSPQGGGSGYFDPTGPKVDPNAGGSGNSGSSGENSGGSPEGFVHIIPHRYSDYYYTLDLPDHWVNLEVRKEGNCLLLYYRGLLFAWIDVLNVDEIWHGDPSCYLVMEWQSSDPAKHVCLFTNNYAYDIVAHGKISRYDGSTVVDMFTSDADLGDVLYRQTGRWFDIGTLKNRLANNIADGMESPYDEVICGAINAVSDFLVNNVVPRVMIMSY